MSRVFFRNELEGVATFWRVARRDGVTLGFTSHDRDIWLDGLLYRAAPGMLPSAVRRSADLAPDSVEVEGALAHDAISSSDLAAGRFDGARIQLGVLDWESGESTVLYRGEIGAITEDAEHFSAEMLSAKVWLEVDPVPRTSPTCRAEFCGPGCTLSAARFTHDLRIASVDFASNTVVLAGGPPAERFRDGRLRWLDGTRAGLLSVVVDVVTGSLLLEDEVPANAAPGWLVRVREGCDHTIAACSVRFGNAANFQGEPFLPGNDILARYPTSTS